MPTRVTWVMKAAAGAGMDMALSMIPNQANAQIQFTGWTNGCFGASCVPTNSNGTLVDVVGTALTYKNATINQLVASGSTVQLNSPKPSRLNNFGLLVTRSGSHTLVNIPFNLMITLTAPTSGQIVFEGLLNGTITNGTANNVQLAFTNTPWNVTWSNNGNGSATITINNLTMNGTGDTYAVTGTVYAQVTPEPISMVLLGSGLLGLGGAARRRRKNQKSA